MSLFIVNILDGLVTGLLLFMLCSGLTLIFSMMGVLNFAHASFYMLGAYFAYQISLFLGFWVAPGPLPCGFDENTAQAFLAHRPDPGAGCTAAALTDHWGQTKI